MTANERRKAIIEVLCLRRFDTRENLAFEFGVVPRTIEKDIVILSTEYPIYTTQGRGGGIHVVEGFRLNKDYLNDEQEELLTRLMPGLKGKDAEVMKSILKTFGLKGKRSKKK
ncbi:MAG: HTH domain-containing protein [Clostridia bacterium]|nr:HTH domain-containing protein [Clostridia bacterium]